MESIYYTQGSKYRYLDFMDISEKIDGYFDKKIDGYFDKNINKTKNYSKFIRMGEIISKIIK